MFQTTNDSTFALYGGYHTGTATLFSDAERPHLLTGQALSGVLHGPPSPAPE